ncbi:hypothetical protein [Aureimonas leprariae]|uniref:Uncharacterized protein n=1 Tax=Plantimonas leprariae TaxID=2615207 RepID=A0A7V7PQR3_9HYPH|nr:hypothetical protein [Aureimonas leprariae]KAB0680757.1 hypothetical protein F6X38_07095 [Aureimonas leprariae]
MLLRSILLLVVGIAAVPRAAHAVDFDLFSSVRVAEISYRTPAVRKGERRPRRAPILLPPDDLGCADSFRSDELEIWSSTTGTIWRLLPPKFLGVGALMDVIEVE